MSHLEFYRCDDCGKNLENVECSPNQLQYTLIENGDFGGVFHFCSKPCLNEFVQRDKWKNNIKPGEMPYGMTLGDFNNMFAQCANSERMMHDFLLTNSHEITEKLYDLYIAIQTGIEKHLNRKLTRKEFDIIKTKMFEFKKYIESYGKIKYNPGIC